MNSSFIWNSLFLFFYITFLGNFVKSRTEFWPNTESQQNEQNDLLYSKVDEYGSQTCYMKGFSPSDVKLLTENSDNPYVFTLNDTTKYELEDLDENMVRYKFKEGANCVSFKYCNKIVWNHDSNENSEYPKAIYLHKHKLLSFVQFNENSYYFYRILIGTMDWKFNQVNNVSELSVSDMKVYTKDDDDSQQTNENNQDQYELKNYGFAYAYKLKPNSKCVELKYKDSTLWKHNESKYGDSYPLEIYLMGNLCTIIIFENRCSILLNNKNKRFLENKTQEITPNTPEGSNQTTKQEEDKISTDTTEQEQNENAIENNEHQLEHQDEKQQYDNNEEEEVHYKDEETTYSKLYSHLVQIITSDDEYGTNIKTNDINKYTMDLVEPNKVHYKFKDGAKCIELKYDGNPVWKYDVNENGKNLPTEFQVDMEQGHIVVLSGNEWFCDYKCTDKFILEYYWKKLDRSEYPQEVKIATVLGSEHSESEKDGNNGYSVSRYYKKGKHLQFAYKFEEGVKCVSVGYENETVWEHQEPKQYPVNVTYVKDEKVFVLIYKNGTVTYKKTGDKWVVIKEKNFKENDEKSENRKTMVLIVVFVVVNGVLLSILILTKYVLTRRKNMRRTTLVKSEVEMI